MPWKGKTSVKIIDFTKAVPGIRVDPKPQISIPPFQAERLPWTEIMTLCVAAECVHDGEARFVFAKDFAVQAEISSAEIEAKWTSIGKADYPALIAGSPPKSPSGQVKMQWITPDYDKYMDRMFAKFGPKKTSGIKFLPRAVKLNNSSFLSTQRAPFSMRSSHSVGSAVL